MASKTLRRKAARERYMAGRAYEARLWWGSNRTEPNIEVNLVPIEDIGVATYGADVIDRVVPGPYHGGFEKYSEALAAVQSAAARNEYAG